MPSGFWHYIYYTEGGFALSLRSPPKPLSQKLKGVTGIAKLLIIDRLMTRILGAKKWYAQKEKMAIKKAHRNKIFMIIKRENPLL